MSFQAGYFFNLQKHLPLLTFYAETLYLNINQVTKVIDMKKKLFIAFTVTICLVFGLLGSSVSASPPEMVRVIIGFDRQPGLSEQHLLSGAGGSIKHTYTLVPAIAASIPHSAIQGLSRNPRVISIEPDIAVYAIDTELDNSWGVKHIGAGMVHQDGNKGTGVKIAVIDSGIDYNHPDLNDNYAGGYDFYNDDGYPMDDDGHGTHVAGTIGAEDNDSGVVGVAPEADIYALKILGADGSGSYSDVIAALEWCVDNDIQVTNNSYGSSGDPGDLVKQAFDNANAAGIINIAAAGNEGNPPGRGDNVIYPARWDSVIAVAATDSSDKRAKWSSTGPDVELAAPGVSIVSTLPGGVYGIMSGTSMASPHAAGTAALVISSGINGNDAVRQQLINTARDLGEPGLDNYYGYGLLDAAAAATLVSPNIPPVAEAGPDRAVMIYEEVSLDGSGSYDPDGSIVSYDWSFGDGDTGSGVTITHSYSTAGTYEVSLTVTDGSGATDTDTLIITVTGTDVSTMHVSGIEISIVERNAGPNVFTSAKAVVTVKEASGNPVGGASVYGHWSGLTSDSDSGVTDGGGQVILTSDAVKNESGTFTFNVDDIVKDGWVYDPSADVETIDSAG